MTLGTAMQEWAEAKKAQVEAETWGHLAPKSNRSYRGYIVFAVTAWGVSLPINAEFKELPDSPWAHSDMLDFIGNHTDDTGVYRFEGTYTKLTNGECKFLGYVCVVDTARGLR